MKKYTICLCLGGFLSIQAPSEHELLYIEKYLLPPGVLRSKLDGLFRNERFLIAFKNRDKKTLQALGCTLYGTTYDNIVAEHKDIPGWLMKGPKRDFRDRGRNLKRVEYGHFMRKVARGFPDFVVPQEYLYHYPDATYNLNNANYCVISEKLSLDKRHLGTLKPTQIQNIQRFMHKVGFWDANIKDNIRITTDGKIAFIDTEPFVSVPVVQFIIDYFYFEGLSRGEASIRYLKKHLAEYRMAKIIRRRNLLLHANQSNATSASA